MKNVSLFLPKKAHKIEVLCVIYIHIFLFLFVRDTEQVRLFFPLLRNVSHACRLDRRTRNNTARRILLRWRNHVPGGSCNGLIARAKPAYTAFPGYQSQAADSLDQMTVIVPRNARDLFFEHQN